MINQTKIGRNCLNMRDEIAIVPSHNIDHEKWDRCINESSNGLIYTTSVYLDHLTDHWTGFVLNDYKMVMAVAWRKKYGIRYSYNVSFIQQLGIICQERNANESLFLQALSSYCRYGDYPFNFSNSIGKTTDCVNFILPLDRKYEDISRGFARDVLQNIRKAEGGDLQYKTGEMDEAVDCYRRLYGQQSGISEEEFKRFSALCNTLEKRGNLIVRKVTGGNDSLLATVLLPNDKRRMYNVMNSTLPEGKSKEANYFLLSRLWKEYEQSGMIFDFEGSGIRGVSDFYRKFGSVNQPYYKLHFNHLSWPMKLFKK